MGRSRSRSRDRDRRRRSRSRSRDRSKSSRRRSPSRSRDRDREKRSNRSRSRDRGRDGVSRRDRSRSHSRDRKKQHESWDSRSGRRSRSRSPRGDCGGGDKKPPEATAATADVSAETAEEKLRRRREMLSKWKQNKEQPKSQEQPKATQEAAWMPWEDPGALQSANVGAEAPPPPMRPERLERQPEPEDDGVDPLDAFMAAEVMPEVKAAEQERKKAQEEERVAKAKMLAEGKKIPKLADLEDSEDEEEVADVEIEIPANKVKLLIGPGGTKIGEIQKKTKCRVQVKKTDAELNIAFGSGPAVPTPPADPTVKKMVTIMLYGDSKATEMAQKMIEEAIDNKEQKQKQRQQEYERKREQKRIRREMYYLRHARDYQTLGVPVGTSKADVRKAYRKMAIKWHPDKHQSKSEEERAEAEKKFQEIQRAFDSLMSTDEDDIIEQLKGK